MRNLIFLAGATLLAQAPPEKTERPAPVQPLPYSHKLHAGTLKLPCKQCHTIPEPGDFATLPATKTCMACHSVVKKESPHIAELAAAHAENRKIAWLPVYKIPEYVGFSHKVHTAVEGVTCQSCHGPVAEREVLRRETDISMPGCMSCHRTHNASNNCLFCHDQR